MGLTQRRCPQAIELEIGGAEPMRIEARCLVNCAGLTAPSIARRIESELEYPGQIKVTVIRETRATDYAK